jgi:mRNA interferase MazF
MKRGEIRWYKFKKPDKKRPVLILTRDSVIDCLGEITVAPLTTRIRDIPTEVVITKADGMPEDCCINLDHMQTVSKGNIGSLITTLSGQKLNQVREAILFALGF